MIVADYIDFSAVDIFYVISKFQELFGVDSLIYLYINADFLNAVLIEDMFCQFFFKTAVFAKMFHRAEHVDIYCNFVAVVNSYVRQRSVHLRQNSLVFKRNKIKNLFGNGFFVDNILYKCNL